MIYIIGESCRYCGCSESAPCIIPENMVDVVGSAVCGWLIPGAVCNAPSCLERHYRDLVAFIEPAISSLFIEPVIVRASVRATRAEIEVAA